MKIKNQSSYDILFIDKKIQKKINDDKENIDKIEDTKKKLERKLTRTRSYRDSKEIADKIEKLSIHIRDIKSDIHNSMYISRTSEILANYTQLLEKAVEKDFVSGKTKNKNDTIDDENRKEELINLYISIAQEYIEVPKLENKIKKIKNVCVLCGYTELEENTEYTNICYDCGAENILIQNKPTYRDIDRVNITTKYKYDRISHFKDIMNKYQAKQSNNIPDKVFEYIRGQLKSHGLLGESEESNIKYSKVKKSHISMFLKEGGFSEHYDDCIYIYCNITRKSPPNISHIEEKIMDDFKLLIETYNIVKNSNHWSGGGGKKRKNFLNSQYVLYQLLRRHKYKCKKEDFNILKTRDRRMEHDEVYMGLCEKLKWTFTTTI